MRFALCIVLLALVLWASRVSAADPPGPPEAPARLAPVAPPGQYGPVWPIAEEDIRTTILTRFHERMPELQEQLADSLRSYRLPTTPRPTTDTPRTVVVDPSITVDTDLVAPDGRLLARAGDRINPLGVIGLLRTYLVINAADPRQLAWAARQVRAALPRPTTVLLTEGDLEAAEAALPAGTKLFPAPPELFARFPLDSVPARLHWAGDQLQIDFVAEGDLD